MRNSIQRAFSRIQTPQAIKVTPQAGPGGKSWASKVGLNTASKPGSGFGNIPSVGATPGPAVQANNNSGTPQYNAMAQPLNAAPDPRDPTYWTDIGTIEQYYKNQNAALDESLTRGQTSLKNQLAQLDYNQPRDIQNTRENYNSQGLLYSTALGRATGDVVSKYTNARNQANTAYGDLVTNINRARTDLEDQYGVNGTRRAGAYSNAVGRQTQADATSASNNALASLTAALTGGIDRSVPMYNRASGMTPKQFLGNLGGTVRIAGGKQWIVYPDGRKVRVG